MSGSEYAEFLSALKEKNDIVEVIGSYIKLDRRGYNFWACCPFHHEKTPSFSVNASDRYYHCFGCGVSGDVITFVKEYENVDFRQAVEILAKRAGLEVPAFDDRSREETEKRKQKRDRLLLLTKTAARFYLSNLYSGKAEAHLEYIAKRRLQPTIVKKFGLGASLDYHSLPAFLRDSGFSAEECEESGVCSLSDGKLIDAQGGRLIIPIINNMDEVIAFGGRVLEKTDRAKYKNTRDTLLFDKSKNLYNINLVKKLKRAGGISSLIMVEGYMDAISLYQAGFENVVASMGTSLTKEQARLCKRYTDNVYISYDGDFAGQKANLRGLDILKSEGLKVRVVPLPEGLDPDDVIKTQGQEGYRNCLDGAMPLIDFRIRAAAKKYDLSRTDEKRDFVRESLAIVRDAESATEREELLKQISAQADVSVTSLMRDLESVPKRAEDPPSPPVKKEEGDRERKAELFLLAACLFSKPYALGCDLFEFGFDDETLEKVAEFIMEGRERGQVQPSGLFDVFGAENGAINELMELNDGNLEGGSAEKYFRGCVRILRSRELKRQIEVCRAAIKQSDSREEYEECLKRLGELTKKLSNLK